MKKGNYYKQVGGYKGALYDGRVWKKFVCDGCLMAAGVVDPKDRIMGSTNAARNALQFGDVFYPHDRELHNAWLRAGKPLPFDHPAVDRYIGKYPRQKRLKED